MLNNYTQDKQSKLWAETGSFFAFSAGQLNDALYKNGLNGFSSNKDDYCQLAIGLICPKDKAQFVEEQLEVIHQEAVKAMFQDYTRKQVIEWELANHEAAYTHCIDDTVDKCVLFGITREEVAEVFNVWVKKQDV